MKQVAKGTHNLIVICCCNRIFKFSIKLDTSTAKYIFLERMKTKRTLHIGLTIDSRCLWDLDHHGNHVNFGFQGELNLVEH